MTTAIAAALYEAEHVAATRHLKTAVFNPENKPVESLPVIYGFNNGGPVDWLTGQILAEDGTALGGHICSSEAYMPHDLGILEGTRPDRHEHFRLHYPGGYRMEFVGAAAVKSHAGLMKAYALNQAQADQSAKAGEMADALSEMIDGR